MCLSRIQAKSWSYLRHHAQLRVGDYGLEASNPYDINTASNVDKLAKRLRTMRPSIVLYNLPGVDKRSTRSVLQSVCNEPYDYIRDTAFILVALDSMTSPVLTRATRNKVKELKNVEEHIFHPGGNSAHYCGVLTNMPASYARYLLSQTSDRAKNRLAVFAVKLRESFKGLLVGHWVTGQHRATPSFSWIHFWKISVLLRSKIQTCGIIDLKCKSKSAPSSTRSPQD